MRSIRRYLPLISGALCAVCLLLILIDAIWPRAYLFNSGFVKLLVLATCLLAAACGALLVARDRAAARRGRR